MKTPGRRFILEKKLVAQVRYYEHMYLIRDKAGQRVYTGTDEKTAKSILRILNACAGETKWKDSTGKRRFKVVGKKKVKRK